MQELKESTTEQSNHLSRAYRALWLRDTHVGVVELSCCRLPEVRDDVARL